MAPSQSIPPTSTGSLVIAGAHSGVGKTTLTIGLLAALRERGLKVQPFKIGPDFIDPGHHRSVAGVASRNLDSWMLSHQTLRQTYSTHSAAADISVIEGVMGLSDGSSGLSEDGSTAQVAKLIGAPVVLVVDASSMARSAAALVHGFETFDPELNVAGVIFNRVGSEGHYRYLCEAVGSRCNTPALGYVVHDEALNIPERHLGLVTSAELTLNTEFIERLVASLEATVDIDALITVARRQPPLRTIAANQAPACAVPERPRIGIAFDRAFCFYYEDNFDLLRAFGAELVFFSALEDGGLPPNLQGLYLGGGYPELFAQQLSANRSMRQQVARFIDEGKPVYAECGGFMYLTRSITTSDGEAHEMVGAFPARTRMLSRLNAIGYVEVEQAVDTIMAPAGEISRGHEFHHSELVEMPDEVPRAYRLRHPPSKAARREGYQVKGALGSYFHLHFGSNPTFARGFVTSCAALLKGAAV